MNTEHMTLSTPASPQTRPVPEAFHCWPELSLSIVLCLLAYVSPDCVALVAWGGMLIVGIFAARAFLSPRANLLGLRSLAILAYGLWMFLGMARYVLGERVHPFFILYYNEVNTAARLTALGFCAMLVGLQILPFKRVPHTLLVRRELSPRQLHMISAVFILGSSTYLITHNNFFGFIADVPFYIGMIAPLCVPGLILLGYLVAVHRAYTKHHAMSVVILCLLGFSVAVLDPSRRGVMTALLGIMGIVALRRGFLMTNRGPVSRFFLLGFTILLLSSLYVLGSGMRAVSFSNKTFSGFTETFRKISTQGKSLQPFFALEFVVEEYPRPYHFIHGSSVINLLFNFVPRSIWPSKPVGFSKELAMRMEGIPESVRYSRQVDAKIGYQSYSGTMVGEGYANFGVAGVIGFLFVFGVLVSFIERYVEWNWSNQFAIMLYACSIAPVLIQQRGDLLCANFYSIQAIGSIYIATVIFGKRIPRLGARGFALKPSCQLAKRLVEKSKPGFVFASEQYSQDSYRNHPEVM